MKFKSRHEILIDNELTLAPIWKRGFALTLDCLVLILVFVAAQFFFKVAGLGVVNIHASGFTHVEVEGKELTGLTKFLIQVSLIWLPTLYFTLLLYFFQGRTLGKMALRIRVLPIYHHRLGFWHCLERSLGYAASTLELGLGFLQATWNKNRMALHDKIAETVVCNVK
jgi:uncharacterized RDD family membrane protein YckC